MLRGLGFLTVIALLAAGCVSPAADLQTASVDDALGAAQRLVSFDASGVLPVDEDFRDMVVRISNVGESGPEPSLGVLSDGTLFITAGSTTLARSTDHGASWDVIETGDALMRPKASLDPWMWVDPWTDRVYNAPLYVACTWASWSDDAGESWAFNPIVGCAQGIPAHDHQKLTSGPAVEGVQTSGYENVVYYSYNSFRTEGTWVQRSLDGGLTFDLGGVVHAQDACHSGIAGPVAVGDDGVAYSPKPTCDGIAIAVSKDSGVTWTVADVEGVGSANALAHMTDAAVDKGLNAYATWNGEDGLAYVTRTTDQGATWSEPLRVSPPGVNVTAHNVIIAGEAGRVAVAYLGTRADATKWEDKNAQEADDEAVWHLFLSQTEDALAEDPVWTTVQVTPDEDPVQIGAIWLSGGSGEDGNRNLLDFIDMVQVGGRVYIGYADGCDACDSVTESKGDAATVAIVERGPSLLGGVLAPLAELVDEATREAEAGSALTPIAVPRVDMG